MYNNYKHTLPNHIKYRIIGLLVLTIALAGCTLGNRSGVNSTVINGQDKLGTVAFREGDVVQKINELNSVAANGQSQQAQAQAQQQAMELEDLADTYDQAILRTNKGDIRVQFYVSESPLTTNNFMNLANKGFYNGTTFHRVIRDFMIQGGDPNSKDDDWSNDGTGGPGYQFQDEINQHKLVRGSLAMANSGPNTNGSQFFIVTAPATPHLDGKHTNFGYVIEGMDIVDAIEAVTVNENKHPLDDIVVEDVLLLSSKDTRVLNDSELRELENVQDEEHASTTAN